MKTKTPKAQEEVWAAKERLSEKLLKLPVSGRLAYIVARAKQVANAMSLSEVTLVSEPPLSESWNTKEDESCKDTNK